MADKIRLDSKYDLKGNYQPSDSEDDYSPEEKRLLAKVRQRNKSDTSSEEEVYAFSESEEDENDDINVADSDVEGQEASDDDLPDVKAWGQKKRAFYNTDYVDEDFGGFGKDEKAATIEEEEAKALQKRLTEQLADEDFSLDFFSSKKDDRSEKDNEAELIKSDLSVLPKRQKIQLLKKESPEFAGLVEDFKGKMATVNDLILPILTLVKKKKLPKCPAIQFIETYKEIILNYCTNISFYIVLKTKKIPIQCHPVTKCLLQYRQMLKQLQPIYDNSIKDQLDKIIRAINTGADVFCFGDTKQDKNKKSDSYKKLKILHNKGIEKENNDTESDVSDDQTKIDDMPFNNIANVTSISDNIEETKRAITYQMAKNKGLTPRRKKEQRNPRVKHRNKYRKAKIRRKGAVREVRNELTRYSGEMSGIKTNVKKSIKIK